MPGSSESGMRFAITVCAPVTIRGKYFMVMSKAEWRRRRRKKKMIRKYVTLGLLACIFVLVLVLLVKVVTAIFAHMDGGIIEKAGDVKITQSLLSVSRYARCGEKLEAVDEIIIHSNNTVGKTAQEQRDYYESLKTKKNDNERQSMHFIIDLDGKIYQCIPTNEIALAVAGNIKFRSLSIEYCITGADGSMSAATYTSLCKLVATLCQEYKLNEKKVFRHFDKNQVPCPMFFVNEANWEQFKTDVKAARNGKKVSVTNAPINNIVAPHTGDTQEGGEGESGEGSGTGAGTADGQPEGS